MKAVQINNLYKSFGDKLALNNLCLGIEEGEIYGLLGPNGAGKSTTINILSGLLKSDRGEVKVFNKAFHEETRFIKQNMGIVPQELALFEGLTAYENVSFFVSLYGITGKIKKECVMKALSFVGLQEKAKDKTKTFSGGMKRRLNIACAIAHDPKLIIMDEPTVGIDPQSRNHILNAIKELNRKGTTIIYTTHYMEEAEALCDRLAIIDQGFVIAEGTRESLKDIMSDKNIVTIGVSNIEKIEEKVLENINGVVAVQFKDNLIKITSKKEVMCLDKIISYLAGQDIKIMDVSTQITNLEDVFLGLTGRTLRD